jgi:GDP-4-dehydro-6-deoxy-D-mannose reductase
LRVLVTGISGFAGSHLAELALSRGARVFGTIRWRSRRENIEHIEDQIELIDCDLKDPTSVRNCLVVSKPDFIFHLAAQSFVPTSWHAPVETLCTNIIGQVNMFEAVRDLGMKPRIQLACSSEEYGMVYEDEIPIKENNPLRPLSPYAVSKVTQDMLGYQYFMSYGMDIIRTRAFNHTGPRRGYVFVTSNFAKQIAQIEKGKREPIISTGNLEAKRDFSDVRDVVRAYWLALEKGKSGEVYNIASGRVVTIKEMLDMLLAKSTVNVKTKQDPSRMRPSDVELLIGDFTKITEQTGWKPEIPLEKTLEDLLNYWRERV